MNPMTRYQARVEELEALRAELQSNARRDDPGPVAGRVLEAAGDLLRRKKCITCDGALIDTTLKLLSPDGIKSFTEALSVDELRSRLLRAADEAVEAALPDNDEDSSTWNAWAMQGLLARDRAESVCRALTQLAGLGRQEAAEICSRLKGALDQLDAQTKHCAAALTALNSARRAERDLLDEQVWWFCLKCEEQHDGLVKALGSDTAIDEVTKKRRRPVSFDELFRYDLGLSTDAEAAFIAAQKKSNPELARALAAMEEGERAIIELTGAAPVPTPDNVRPLRRAAGQGQGQVVDERPEFRVLVFRRSQRVHLVVQPVRDGALAAAAVYLPDSPETPRTSHATEAGLDFELGPEEQLLRTTARVVVTLKGGRSTSIAVRL
jgi:hypothetical protein